MAGMSTAGEPPSQRVGNAERTAAIEALNQHWRAGRLDPSEHEARTTRAHSAVRVAELDALFTDLPRVHDGSIAPWQPPPTPVTTSDQTEAASQADRGLVPAGSWLGQRRDAVMGVVPFVAMAGFFLLGHNWVWFLLIPLSGALLYAGSDHDGRRGRTRRRHRN